MMKCPHCNQEVNGEFNYRPLLELRVKERLEEYGYQIAKLNEWYPAQYQAYTHVRSVMKIRLGEERLPKGMTKISEQAYYEALNILDEILPSKKREAMRGHR